MNITIFTDHETDMLFTTNYPEVYLSCDTGRVRLSQVRRVGIPYEFLDGLNATSLEEGGCVNCRLRESDATELLADDTFGEWTMCDEDFAETGFYEIEDPGQFYIRFQCPDCQNLDLITFAPPSEAPEESLPGSEPAIPPETDAGTYYYTVTETEGTTLSEDDSNGDVVLQSDQDAFTEEGSSGGMSAATVLSLCFVFLAVGVGLGVVLFWRFSKSVRHERTQDLQLSKLGFDVKKAKY